MVIILKLQFLSAMSIKIIKSLQQNVYVTNFQHWIKIYKHFLAEGAFKKLKPEPNSGGLSSLSGSGISSPGSGISSLPHVGHTPTTVSCPTPARRRHRTTFTQVCKARASTQTLQEKKYSNDWNSIYNFLLILSMVNRNNWQNWKQLLRNHIIPIFTVERNWRELQSWMKLEYRWAT